MARLSGTHGHYFGHYHPLASSESSIQCLGRSFRAFLHPTQAIHAVLSRNGFQQRFYRKTRFFQVAVYAR